MATQTSPNMGIVCPVVLSELGPAWAQEIFTALFSTIDGHDHTAGKGKLIATAALNINADLAFGSFNATALRSARFTQQSSNLNLGSDVGCLSDVLGNLVWNNSTGVAVQITNGSSVVSASALTAPVTGTGRLVASTYAVDGISPDYYLLVDTTAGTFQMTLPTPTAQRTLVIVDTKGNFGTAPLTLAPHALEKINGLAATKVLSSPWAMYFVVSNGTDWFVAGA